MNKYQKVDKFQNQKSEYIVITKQLNENIKAESN